METSRPRDFGNEESCACGTRNYKEPLIIGGEPVTDLRKYPWLVSIHMTNAERLKICGASIISSYYVLTAAHCIPLNVLPSMIRIGLKGEELIEPLELMTIQSYIIHPQFHNHNNDITFHDVALLKTDMPIPCSDYNRPICIPKINIFMNYDDVIISGWGISNDDADKGVLLEGTVKILDNVFCNEMSKALYEMPADVENIICTIGNPQTSCNGDSGSPLVAKHKDKFYAIGITAFGYIDECIATNPGVFMNVASYYSFIKEHVEDLPNM